MTRNALRIRITRLWNLSFSLRQSERSGEINTDFCTWLIWALPLACVQRKNSLAACCLLLSTCSTLSELSCDSHYKAEAIYTAKWDKDSLVTLF